MPGLSKAWAYPLRTIPNVHVQTEEFERMSGDDGCNRTGPVTASVSKLCEMEATGFVSLAVEVKKCPSKQIVLRELGGW